MPFEPKSYHANEKPIRSKNGFSPERILQDINNVLSAPLPFDIPTSQADAAHFVAVCPWCCTESLHAFVGRGILLKLLFQCDSCSEQTSRCINFSSCAAACKVAPFWGDAFCERCEGRAYSEPATERSPAAPAGGPGRSRGSRRRSPSPPAAASPPASARRGRALTRPAGRAELCAAARSDDGGSGSESDADPGDGAVEDGEDSGEGWAAVRDALLRWPVPEERAEVERRCDLVAHRVWVRRWALQYPGDGALAARKILEHLRWRREYGLDTIMDEAGTSLSLSLSLPLYLSIYLSIYLFLSYTLARALTFSLSLTHAPGPDSSALPGPGARGGRPGCRRHGSHIPGGGGGVGGGGGGGGGGRSPTGTRTPCA